MPNIDLHSSAGHLRAIHDLPQGSLISGGPRAAVVCHPHPQYGGTMDNKVVFTVAKALNRRGLHVVRFNFRGVGGSAGVHDEGVGEQDDVRAAMDFAADLVGGGPGCLLMAGFSFGSWVGINTAAQDERVAGLLAVAPPVNFYDFSAAVETTKPLSVIYALEDELVSAQAVQDWLATVDRPHLVTPVPGAGHLFHGRLEAIRVGVAATLCFVCAPADPA